MSESEKTAFCIDCCCEQPYVVSERNVQARVSDVLVIYTEKIAHCPICGAEMYVPELNDENCAAREKAYADKIAVPDREATIRSNIMPGLRVKIVLKEDQPSGKLTEGVVDAILTNSANHPRGIKVRLKSGLVGRVRRIVKEG